MGKACEGDRNESVCQLFVVFIIVFFKRFNYGFAWTVVACSGLVGL
jgi:hypothetical protein